MLHGLSRRHGFFIEMNFQVSNIRQLIIPMQNFSYSNSLLRPDFHWKNLKLEYADHIYSRQIAEPLTERQNPA
jgi:hypothetical protein